MKARTSASGSATSSPLVNEYCSIDGPEAEVFRTIVHLERRFFDDSYPQE